MNKSAGGDSTWVFITVAINANGVEGTPWETTALRSAKQVLSNEVSRAARESGMRAWEGAKNACSGKSARWLALQGLEACTVALFGVSPSANRGDFGKVQDDIILVGPRAIATRMMPGMSKPQLDDLASEAYKNAQVGKNKLPCSFCCLFEIYSHAPSAHTHQLCTHPTMHLRNPITHSRRAGGLQELKQHGLTFGTMKKILQPSAALALAPVT